MPKDPALPDWLTGLTPEDEWARELQNPAALPPESGARPPDLPDDLAWLDEFIDPAAAHSHAATPPAFAPGHQPRVTRITSTPTAPAVQPPTGITPAATSVSAAPPPSSAPPSNLPGRFSFRRLPAWWQSQGEHRSRSNGPLPAWLRE